MWLHKLAKYLFLQQGSRWHDTYIFFTLVFIFTLSCNLPFPGIFPPWCPWGCVPHTGNVFSSGFWNVPFLSKQFIMNPASTQQVFSLNHSFLALCLQFEFFHNVVEIMKHLSFPTYKVCKPDLRSDLEQAGSLSSEMVQREVYVTCFKLKLFRSIIRSSPELLSSETLWLSQVYSV